MGCRERIELIGSLGKGLTKVSGARGRINMNKVEVVK